MKVLLAVAILMTTFACIDRPPDAEYALTTEELERYYSANRMDADRQYTKRNIKVTGIVASVEPIDNASLLTFKSLGSLEVLCRMDKPESLKPGDRVSVIAWNAGLEQRWIKLFNCVVIK